jgi:hypothetical protein
MQARLKSSYDSFSYFLFQHWTSPLGHRHSLTFEKNAMT